MSGSVCGKKEKGLRGTVGLFHTKLKSGIAQVFMRLPL
jgi:hypothetical protein